MFNKEPTVIINGTSELLRQLLPLLVTVGLINLAPEKLNGWQQIISLVLGFASTILIRSIVVPKGVADRQIEIAKASSVSTPTEQIIRAAKESV